MKKLIIEIHDDIAEADAVAFVLVVVAGGRVSKHGKQYSYATFDRTAGRCCLCPPVRSSAKSDRFIVRKSTE